MAAHPRRQADVDSRSTILTAIAVMLVAVATAVMIGWILVQNANAG